MKKPLNILFLFLFINVCYGQSQTNTIGELKIGDRLPDQVLSKLLNSSGAPVHTDNLYPKGMLLIDFWATWCEPCIKEMKRLDSLKAKFGDSLNVLCVAYEKDKTVKGYFIQHKEINTNRLLIITDDSVFIKLFKHQALPHNVWIDNKGIIRAITGSEDVTADKIHSFLSKKDYNLSFKNDVAFDYRKHLHIPDSLIQYRSIFNTHLKDVNISGYVISDPLYYKLNMTRFYGWNVAIADLFWHAYMKTTGGGRLNPSLIELHTNDSLRFIWPKDKDLNSPTSKYKTLDDWNIANTYAYELVLPHPVKDSLFYSYVIDDLQRVFNVESKIELKKRHCIVVTLKQLGQGLTISPVRNPYIKFKNNVLTIKNATVDDILNWITLHTYGMEHGSSEPYLNNTGFKFPIDMEIAIGNSSVDFLQKVFEQKLMEFGFNFNKGIRDYPVLLISDLN